ncbi:hypothetical protein [Streptomyces sp. NPDC048489]|uniref:hypothetical protein n=1 Tax=Streptomyces sp. NPDC048489 TaxID=3154504 RepID=UPI00342B3366
MGPGRPTGDLHGQVLAALRARDPDLAAATIAEHFADVTARIDRWGAQLRDTPAR